MSRVKCSVCKKGELKLHRDNITLCWFVTCDNCLSEFKITKEKLELRGYEYGLDYSRINNTTNGISNIICKYIEIKDC